MSDHASSLNAYDQEINRGRGTESGLQYDDSQTIGSKYDEKSNYTPLPPDGHHVTALPPSQPLDANAAEQQRLPQEKEEHVDSPSSSQGADDNKAELSRTKSTASIAESLSPWREFLFVSVITLAQFMTQVGLGQTLSIIHVIGDDFGITNPGVLSWLIAGYSLTVGSFILVSGRLGDIFGYKRMLIIGFSWFSLCSMIAGLAVYSNHVLFIFARVLQGIGPSIILPNGLALLGSTYAQGPRKDMVFAIFGAAAPTGSIVGALFAGIFAQLAWWPWSFWSFAITLAITALVGSYVIPDPPKKIAVSGKRSFRQLFDLIDTLGAFTGILALILINFAWNQSGVTGWQEPYVYVCLILGFLLLPVFFYVELRVSSNPLIPFDALSSDVAFVLACIVCGWGSFGIWIYYIWEFLLTLRNLTPLLATAYLSPVVVSGVLASVTTGFLLGKLRPAWVMVIAMVFFLVGHIIIATTPVHQIYWAQIFVCTIVIPWGMDTSFPAGTLILSNAVAKEHQGIGASLVNTAVNYSISIALGFAGTVESHVNDGGNTPAEILKGYRGAWYMGISIAGLGLAISLVLLAKSYWQERKAAKAEMQ